MTETGGGAVTTTAAGRAMSASAASGARRRRWTIASSMMRARMCRAGDAGEFLVRQKGEAPRRWFFTEYLKDEAATAEAWAGGWFHTGDVVFEGDDRLAVLRRPQEEHRAPLGREHRGDRGRGRADEPRRGRRRRGCPGAGRDARRGSVRADRAARAAAATRRARSAGRGRSRAACAERLAYHKVPGHIAFVDAIPVTATQKLQRGSIKAIAAAAVGAPGTIDLRELQGRAAPAREGGRMSRARYDGVVIAAPVTIPYVRYSTRDAHWFVGRALAELVKHSGRAEGAARRLVRLELLRCFPTPRSV